MEARFWSKVHKTQSCWLWVGGANLKGYGLIGWPGAGSGSILAHRYSWMLAHGQIPEGQFVLHKCDTPACVNPEHLFLGTLQDNVTDMIVKGRKVQAVGTRIGLAKLDPDKVREIRWLRGQGFLLTEIGREFGVDASVVSEVCNHKIWRHVL